MTGGHEHVWPVDDFYAADHRRTDSQEMKLPGIWYGERWEESYRLYWVCMTGELVAISDQPHNTASPFDIERLEMIVELLGWCESRPACDRTLSGWSSQTGQLKSLYWVRKRCHLTDTPAIPAGEVTDEHRDRAAGNSGSLF